MHIIKDLLYVVFLFVAVYLILYLTQRYDTLEEKMSNYDCRISEFLPRIPTEIIEECRRRHIELINQQKGL